MKRSMGQCPKIWLSVDRFVLQALQQKWALAVAPPTTSLYSLHLLQRHFGAPDLRLPSPRNYRKAVVTAANEMLNAASAVVTASQKRSSPPPKSGCHSLLTN